MATHFEVFDKLREFGKSLDNSARILPKFTENDEVVTNKARATITLRSMSTEAKKLNEDINRVKTESINANTTFEQFLVICERQTKELKDHIEQLQDHLSKYGYKKCTEHLPDVPSLENTREIVPDTCDHSSPERESEDIKENIKAITNDSVSNADPKVLCSTSPEKQTEETQATVEEPEEFDPLRTPVPPVLATTKLFKYPFDEDGTSSQMPCTPTGDREPCPPETRTPLLKYNKIIDEESMVEPAAIDSPIPPQTKTPLMERKEQKVLETPEVQPMGQSYLDDFPTPPVFQTPGLQRYGSRKREDPSNDSFTLPALPTPPVTSVQLLKPEDIISEDISEDNIGPSSNETVNITTTNTMKLPLINEPEYQHLPSFLKKQFPLEHVNQLLETTSCFLSTKSYDDRMFLSDAELLPVLNLGARTKAFILLMIKLNYLALINNGVYEVTL